MKEKILKIILDRRLKIIEWDGSTSVSFIHPDHYPQLAEEITVHVFEFIEWMGCYCPYEFHSSLKIWVHEEEDNKTTEELYQYWLTNIKNIEK